MVGFIDDCCDNPGIINNFRNVEVQNRFRQYNFMGQNPYQNPPLQPPRYNFGDVDESCGGHNP